MQDFIGMFHLLSAVLVVAGAAKVIAPAGTERALAGARLPSTPALVRSLGLAEIASGVAAVALGGWVLPAVVALFYAGFSGFVAVQLRSGGDAGCGCFGDATTPLTTGHLLFDGAATLVALAFVVDPAPSLTTVLRDQPWAGIPYVLVVAVGVALAIATLTVLPATRAARRAPVAPSLRFGPGA